MNEFTVYKIPGFRVRITQSFEIYPVITDDFDTELHEYKTYVSML